MDEPMRSFAVSRDGVTAVLSPEDHVRLMGISDSTSAAYDLLTDDGIPPELAAGWVVRCQKSGRDPEAWARHVIGLRRSVR